MTNPNWRTVYTKLDGSPFPNEDGTPVVKVEITTEENTDNAELTELQTKYEEVYGKAPAPAYKNNTERLKAKIEEATLVPNE
jgi:hypothetical protein